MERDDRSEAPTYEALTALEVSATETERAAHTLALFIQSLKWELGDLHPAACITYGEANRMERLAIILAARACLVKALVESQFGRNEWDEAQGV